MKTYLITGASGFIGSHLAERILREGNKVINIDNFNNYYSLEIKISNVIASCKLDFFVGDYKEIFDEKLSKEERIAELKKRVDSENYKLEYIDIRDLKELERVFIENKIDIVIHLAGLGGVRPSIEDPLMYEEVNVRGTNNIFEVMRRTGVKKILAASSSSVYGNNESIPFKETDIVDFAISPYAASKKANEVLGHTYHYLFNIDVIMLRFFTVFGPRQRPDLAIFKFTKLIDEDKEIPFFGDGSTSRDYTFIDDIIKGILLLVGYIENNTDVYEISNIGGSDPISLKEMVEIIEKVLGKKAKINRLPMQAGDVNRTYADLTKIKKLVGYKADNTFKQGIEKFIKWYLINKR